MNIMYTLNDGFIPQLLAELCLICENNKDCSKINFYIISRGIKEKNKNKIKN